jgi:uncharacterized membrane protein
MRALFWLGLAVLILGIVSFVVPIPRSQRVGVRAGGISAGIETQQRQMLSPFVGAVMILGGISTMVAGRVKTHRL